MSPHGRREGAKIVTTPKPKPNPLKPEDNKELIGGLKNALERGESIEKVKKSFKNAGYKKEKINILTKEIAETIPKTKEEAPTSTSKKPTPTEKAPTQPTTTTAVKPTQKKPASKKFLIILAIVGVLILTIAGLIGLFWDKIF